MPIGQVETAIAFHESSLCGSMEDFINERKGIPSALQCERKVWQLAEILAVFGSNRRSDW
jgi:hypothetical protein